ncbi:MAG: hypothetical protein GKR88_02630 [Flavobacteriaceae bacterium]|nr:MAG: hypothetical protein GKR88_02630 [Flavobacteriaceae bacterium]
MKILIFLITFLCTVSVTAQFGRQNRNNAYPNTNTGGIKRPKFEPEKLAGLLSYDIKKACKKIGVKEKSDLGKKVVTVLKNYNTSIKDITRINQYALDDLKTTYDASIKIVEETRDISVMKNFRDKIKVVMGPIRKEALKKDSILHVDLKALLDKKQFKKWIKYTEKIKKKAKPRSVRQPVRTTGPDRRRRY